MGVHRVLVSLLDFKSSVAGHKPAGWVRFPHAPAIFPLQFNWLIEYYVKKYREQTVNRNIFLWSFCQLRPLMTVCYLYNTEGCNA